MWHQQLIQLPSFPRGYHLITDHIIRELPELGRYQVGLLHLFIQHTSASLTLNENADPTVRGDMERHINHLVPERQSYYQHNYEGDDDMPAHIKSSMMGAGLTIPIRNGQLVTGTWQGIWLGEHRDHGSCRKIIATLQGLVN